MDDQENKDLNNSDNDSQENQSNSENDSQNQSDDDLKNKGGENEDLSAKADKLLDGTSKDKNFTIPKKKYDEIKARADLYETHAPLLDKVLKDPDLVESLLETQEKDNLEDRVKEL